MQYSPDMESPRNFQLVNKVDCCLSYDSFLALCSKAIVQAFLTMNASQRDLQHTHAIDGIFCLSCDSLIALRSSDSVDLSRYHALQRDLQPA
jgi:hypothetical protein